MKSSWLTFGQNNPKSHALYLPRICIVNRVTRQSINVEYRIVVWIRSCYRMKMRIYYCKNQLFKLIDDNWPRRFVANINIKYSESILRVYLTFMGQKSIHSVFKVCFYSFSRQRWNDKQNTTLDSKQWSSLLLAAEIFLWKEYHCWEVNKIENKKKIIKTHIT